MSATRLVAGQPRRASPHESGELARLIALAFDDLSVTSWLVPAREERARILFPYFRIIVEHAMAHGRVETVPDRLAVAVWLPAGDPTVPPIADYEQRRADACGRHVERFAELDEVMRANHPADPPHEHLAFLAVRPSWQSTGLGSRLLKHRHRELDTTGRPSYLEASTMSAARLYLRHGYRHIGAPFAPVSCSASMWPVWRDPQPVVPKPSEDVR